MKIARWLLMAALMTTSPAQFQQRSQPNPLLQNQCKIGRGGVSSLREGLSVDFHGKECSRVTCHQGGHTEFTECPRVNKTPTNCGNGLFYQKYPHCCDYTYCPVFQNKSTTKWKQFLNILGRYRASRQKSQAVVHNSDFRTRQNSWRRKEAAADATEKLPQTRWNAIPEQYKTTKQNEQAAGRSWLTKTRPQNVTSTNESMRRGSLVRLKRSYSFNSVRTMQLYNGGMLTGPTSFGLQTPSKQPGFINAANKVSDLVDSAIQAVIQKMFGKPYETPGKQTGERGTTPKQLTKAVSDKTLSANTAQLQASVRQTVAEQLVGGAGRTSAFGATLPVQQPLTEHPTELLAKRQEAVGYPANRRHAARNPMRIIKTEQIDVGESQAAARQVIGAAERINREMAVGNGREKLVNKFADITIQPGSRVEQAFGQAVVEHAGQGEEDGRKKTGETRTSPGIRYFEKEPLQIIEDRRTIRMKATTEQRSGVSEKNEKVPRMKSEADEKATPERKPSKAKSGERQETGEKGTGGRTTGRDFSHETTTSWDGTGGRTRDRERTDGLRDRQYTGGRTAGRRPFGERSRDGENTDRGARDERTTGRRSRDWQSTGGQGTGGRYTGGRYTGGGYGGGRGIGGRYSGGRDTGGRYGGGGDTGGRYGGGRDTGGRYGGGRYGGGRDTGRRYGGGGDTGGRYGGGGDTGGRYGGGRDTGGRYGGGRYSGGRYSGAGYSGVRYSGGRYRGGRHSGGRARDWQSTGGRDTGGRDTDGRDTGGRATGGRDTGGRDAGGRDAGGRYTGGRSRSWRTTRNFGDRGRASGGYAFDRTSRDRWADYTEPVSERAVGESETGGAMAPEEEIRSTEVSADGKKKKGKKARRLAQFKTARLAAEKKAARQEAARGQKVKHDLEEDGPTPVMVAEGLVRPGEQTLLKEAPSPQAATNPESDFPTVKGYKAREDATRKRKAKKQVASHRKKEHRTARRKAAPKSVSKNTDETFYVTSSEAEENGDRELFTDAQEKQVLEDIGKKGMRMPTTNRTNPSMLGNIGVEMDGLRAGARRDREPAHNPNRRTSADLTFKDVRNIVKDQLGKKNNNNLEEADAENDIRVTTMEKQSTNRQVNNQTSEENRTTTGNPENITIENEGNAHSQIGGNASINIEKREINQYIKEGTSSQIRGNNSMNNETPEEATSTKEDTKSEYSSEVTIEIINSGTKDDMNATTKDVKFKQVYTKDWYKYNAESRYRKKYERNMAMKKKNKKHNKSKAKGESLESSTRELKKTWEKKAEELLSDSTFANDEFSNPRSMESATSEGKKIKKKQDDGSTSSIDFKVKPGPSLREQKERRMAERRRRKRRRKRRKQLARRRLKEDMNKIRSSMSKITFNKTAVVTEASNVTYEVNSTIRPTRKVLTSEEFEAIRQARKERRRVRRMKRRQKFMARIIRGRLNRTTMGKAQMLANGTVLEKLDTYGYKNRTMLDDGEMYTNSTTLKEEVKPANSSLELGMPFGFFRRDHMTPEEIEERRIFRRERRKMKRITRRRKFAGKKLHEAKIKREQAQLKRDLRKDGTDSGGRMYDRGRRLQGYAERGGAVTRGRGRVGQGYEEEGGYARKGYGADTRRGNGRYVKGRGGGSDGREGGQYARDPEAYDRNGRGGSGRNYRDRDGRNVGERGDINARRDYGRSPRRDVVYLRQADGYMTVDSRNENQEFGHNYDEGGGDVNIETGGYENAGTRGADNYSKKRHDQNADGGEDINFGGRTAGEYIADARGENVDRGGDGDVDGREDKNGYTRAGYRSDSGENNDGEGNGNIDSTERGNVGGRVDGHPDVGDPDAGGKLSIHDTEVVDGLQDVEDGKAPRNRTITRSRDRSSHKSSAEGRPPLHSSKPDSTPPNQHSEEQNPPSRPSDESSASPPGESKRKRRRKPFSSESPDGLPKKPFPKQNRFEEQASSLFYNSPPKQKRTPESPPTETLFNERSRPIPRPTFAGRSWPRRRGVPTDMDYPQRKIYYRELGRVRQRFARGMTRYQKKLTPKQMLLRQRQQAHRAKIRNRHKTPYQLKIDEKRRRARREKARKVKNRIYPVARKGKMRKGGRKIRRRQNKIYRRHR